MRFIIIGAVLLAAVTFTRGDDGPGPGRGQIATKDQTMQFTDRFLGVLVNGRSFDAFQLIKGAIPDAEADVDAQRQTTEQLLDSVRPTYGKVIGFEHLDTKSLGESFVRYDYLLKMEKSALHFRIIYYQPTKNRWIPVTLFFEENLRQIFDDLGK